MLDWSLNYVYSEVLGVTLDRILTFNLRTLASDVCLDKIIQNGGSGQNRLNRFLARQTCFGQNELEDKKRTINERFSWSRFLERCVVAPKIPVRILVSAPTLYFFNVPFSPDFLETKNKLGLLADFSPLAPPRDILRAYQ